MDGPFPTIGSTQPDSANRLTGEAKSVFRPDQRFLTQRSFAVKAPCRVREDELVSAVFARQFSQNPIKRYLDIIRMAMFAGFDFLLSTTNDVSVDC